MSEGDPKRIVIKRGVNMLILSGNSSVLEDW